MVLFARRFVRHRSAMRTRIAAVALAVSSVTLASFAGQPAGQGGAAKPAAPKPPATVLMVERADLSTMLTDPRDAGLKNALSMIPARIADLSHEIPDFPPEAAAAIQSILKIVPRQARLRVCYTGDAPTGGLFGYGVSLSFLAQNQADADALHGTVTGMLAQHQEDMPFKPQPSQRFKGMTDFNFPFGVMSFGPRQTPAGWRYEVHLGTVENPDAGAEVLPKPFVQGFEPCLRGRVDFHGFTPAIDFAKSASGNPPEMQKILTSLTEAGLVGPGAMKVNFQIGHTDAESVSAVTLEGAGDYAAHLHMSKDPLTPADLAAVPADAALASVGKGDFAWVGDMLEELRKNGAPVDDFLNQFKDHTGVDLKTDIFDTLGGTFAMYLSDSTGGGSLLSGVCMITVKDRAKFAAAHAKLLDHANAATAQIPDGGGKYVRLTPWKDGESDMVTLRFPGLPVPAEITYALTKNWLIIGLTPQACIAAARQASGKGDEGLGSNPALATQLPKGKQVTSVSYVDSARYMKSGYPFVTLLGSAIANGMRTPGGQGRDPGLVVPLFNDLRKNVHASVGYSYWQGNDWVMEQHGDRSLLVNVSGAFGVVGQFLPLIAIPAAAGAAAAQQHHDYGLLPDDWQQWGAAARTLAVTPGAWPFLLSPMHAELIAAGVVGSGFAPETPALSPRP